MNGSRVKHTAWLLLPLLLSCSSPQGSTSDQAKTIVGRIQVIGNEPFAHLAVEAEKGETYVLQCDSLTMHRLVAGQGQLARIHFTSIENVPEGKAIKVVEAELLPPKQR